MRRKLIWIAPLALLALALFVALGGAIVQHLWNWLLPPLFGWRELSFWQALALLALCRILFGGWSAGGSRGSRVRSRVRERMREKAAAMTPEERDRFRERMRQCWDFDPTEGEPKPE